MKPVSQKRMLAVSILLMVLAFSLAAFIGCGGGSGGGGDDGGGVTPTGSTVTGIIYDNNGLPLDNATVSWSMKGKNTRENSTTTNIRGEFVFYNVTPGVILLTAVKGSLYNKEELLVEESSTVETTINLVPCGQISGLVYNEYTTHFIADTTITLTQNGSTVATQQTDLNGKYYITNVPAGEYIIDASKTGYYSSSSVVTVQADNTKYFEFHLFPITGPTPSPSPSGSPAPPFNGKVYAVIIGINDYPSSDLNYCVSDAQSMKSSFQNSAMWSNASITYLTDRSATKGAIQSAIQTIKNSATSEDRFILTFSGHGTNDVGRAAICVWDDTVTDWEYISDEDMSEWFQGMPCPTAMFIDSCYSGGLIGKSLTKVVNGEKRTARVYTGAPGYNPNFTGTFSIKSAKNVEDLTNIVGATASSGSELSWETSSLGHGVFTYYMVQGLGSSSSVGPADTGANNSISAEEASEYASPRVVEYLQGEQNPQLLDNYSAVSTGLSVKQ